MTFFRTKHAGYSPVGSDKKSMQFHEWLDWKCHHREVGNLLLVKRLIAAHFRSLHCWPPQRFRGCTGYRHFQRMSKHSRRAWVQPSPQKHMIRALAALQVWVCRWPHETSTLAENLTLSNPKCKWPILNLTMGYKLWSQKNKIGQLNFSREYGFSDRSFCSSSWASKLLSKSTNGLWAKPPLTGRPGHNVRFYGNAKQEWSRKSGDR